MNQRIKKLRKALDLTQQEFADKIGMKRNTIANYETDRNEPSNSVITLICKTFNVNEAWLRTGEGEMFLAKPTAALDALAAEHGLSSSDYIAIEKFLALKPESRKCITDYMMAVSASISASLSKSASDPAAVPAHTPEDIAKAREVARIAYDQQLSEKKPESQASSAKESGAG